MVLVEGFLQLALDNKLIGCYKSIVKRSGIEEPSRYIEARNIQQEAVAKTVVDLKKNIVSITERVLLNISRRSRLESSCRWPTCS